MLAGKRVRLLGNDSNCVMDTIQVFQKGPGGAISDFDVGFSFGAGVGFDIGPDGMLELNYLSVPELDTLLGEEAGIDGRYVSFDYTYVF